jgi:hypothetical protein
LITKGVALIALYEAGIYKMYVLFKPPCIMASLIVCWLKQLIAAKSRKLVKIDFIGNRNRLFPNIMK